MLHASETWPLTKTDLQCLQRNDRAMIRQICSSKQEDVATVRSSKLLGRLELEDLDPGPHFEKEKASLVWCSSGAEQHTMEYRLMAGGGWGGGGGHESKANMEEAGGEGLP